MGTLIETIATIVLLILLALLFTHMLNGTATTWIVSKFTAEGTK